MKKEADALSAAGHDIHVLYAFRTAWASEADRLIFETAIGPTNSLEETLNNIPGPTTFRAQGGNGMNGLGIRRGPPVGAFGASSLPSNAMPLIS